MLGAVVGSLLFGLLGFAITHIIGRIIAATVGAIVLLAAVRFVTRRG